MFVHQIDHPNVHKHKNQSKEQRQRNIPHTEKLYTTQAR